LAGKLGGNTRNKPRCWWIILKRIVEDMQCCGLDWLRTGTSVSFCEHNKSSFGSVKVWRILDTLNDWQLLKWV
jgi:hypothetical protein